MRRFDGRLLEVGLPRESGMEDPPAAALALDPVQPRYGGTLFFNEHGIAGCGRCGWRGVPSVVGGRSASTATISSWCPCCDYATVEGNGCWTEKGIVAWTRLDADGVEEALTMRAGLDAAVLFEQPSVPAVGQRVVVKVGRNDPCPCGSGRKAKKCCYG